MTDEPNEKQDATGGWFTEIRERAWKTMQPHCLEISNPVLAARVIWMLAQGSSRLRVSKGTGVRRETVARLALTHRESIERKRMEFASAA